MVVGGRWLVHSAFLEKMVHPLRKRKLFAFFYLIDLGGQIEF